MIDDVLQITSRGLAEQPDPVLFATVSGIYAFVTRTRMSTCGCAPVADGRTGRPARAGRDPVADVGPDGVEMDLVTHDLRKFVRLTPRTAMCWSSCSRPWSCTPGRRTASWSARSGSLTSHHAHHYRGLRCPAAAFREDR